MLERVANRMTFRFSIWAPMCRRPGPRAPPSCFSKLCLASTLTRRMENLTSIPPCRPGFQEFVVKNLRIGDRVLDIGFQRDGAASDFEILGGNDVTAVVRASFAKGQDL